MQSVSITTNVVSSKLGHGEVYPIEHNYVMKFVSDLWQVCGFPPTDHHDVIEILLKVILNTSRHDITEILLKVALNTITSAHHSHT